MAAKGVYEICELPVPEGKRALSNMGTLDLNCDAKGILERHKYRIVARGESPLAIIRGLKKLGKSLHRPHRGHPSGCCLY